MMNRSLDWLADELAQIERAGLLRQRFPRISAQGAEVVVAGERLVNFASNDYLGLANDPLVVEAVRGAIDQHGWGSGASPLVPLTSDQHEALERELAEFEGQQRAILFPTGFAANLGSVAALVDEGDAIYADAFNHASLIDGSRLSKAARHIYRHGDAAHLEELLAQGDGYRRRLIVTDTLFSMDGDLAPLQEIAQLAAHHGAMLLVDEAHATGVWGENGRGVVEHLAQSQSAIDQQVAVRVGTLSKGLGGIGGFVCGSGQLVEWLAHMGRSQMFSTALPAAAAAASRAALRVVREQPERRSNLLAKAAWLRHRLTERGWNVGNSVSQIIPILIGEPGPTMQLARELRERGFWVPGIRPPTVAAGTSRLRVSLTATHTQSHLERLVATLDEVRDRSMRLV